MNWRNDIENAPVGKFFLVLRRVDSPKYLGINYDKPIVMFRETADGCWGHSGSYSSSGHPYEYWAEISERPEIK
jgi:hypothetical protein